MVQLSFIQTQLSDSGKRMIVITTVVIIGRKVKYNSAFSTRTRCYKNIAIKMLVLNTENFWQDRYTFGYQNCTGAVHFWQGRYTFGDQKCTGRYKFGNQKCTARYNFRPVQFLRDSTRTDAGLLMMYNNECTSMHQCNW